jgi:hypothetical protein
MAIIVMAGKRWTRESAQISSVGARVLQEDGNCLQEFVPDEIKAQQVNN